MTRAVEAPGALGHHRPVSSTLIDGDLEGSPPPELDPEGLASTGEDTPGAVETRPREDPELDRLSRRRGEALGRYILLDPIGRGGMGVVYAAYDPELDRRVAVKLLRSHEQAHGAARLSREAQAIARVTHPNVVTVHDVGTFEGGVFVAMELIDGDDLRRWLRESERSITEILEVFRQAGEGLAAAHRAGLIHRDFKPANVLVGRDGTAKVVDFGLARQVEGGLDTNELRELAERLEASGSRSLGSLEQGLTRTGALLGTPAYMAPEQHARGPLDARADQFSFCVALYEALLRQRPFDGMGRVALAIQTNRGEVRPPPRGTAVPARILRAIDRGLRPKPEDRFPSMEALVEALRYDPGRGPRRVAIAGGLVLVLGVGTYGYVREQPTPAEASPGCPDARAALRGTWDEDRRAALMAAFQGTALPYAVDTARFVQTRLDDYASAWVTAQDEACEAARVRRELPEEAHALRVRCLDRRRRDLAAMVGVLFEAKRDVVDRAPRMVAALPAIQACAQTEALRRRYPPPDDPVTRIAVEQLRDRLGEARAMQAAGRYAEGLKRAEAARRSAERAGYHPALAEALKTLAGLQGRAGDSEQAIKTLHAAARLATQTHDDQTLAAAWLDLGWSYGIGMSDHAQALHWLDYAEAVINRLGRPEALRISLLCERGNVQWAQGEFEAAHRSLRACLELRERQDPDHPEIDTTLNRLGTVLISLSQHEQAEATFRRALARATAIRGPDHPQVGSLHNGLGVALYLLHRLEEAEAQYQRAYEIASAALGPEHPDLLYSLGNIASCRRDRGEFAAALEAMQRVRTLVEASFPPEHREVGTTLHNIAELHDLQGEHAQALALYERSLPIRRKVHGPDSPYVGNTLTGQGEALLALGRDRAALEALEQAWAIRQAGQSPDSKDEGRTGFALARALWRTSGDRARARELAAAAREAFTSQQGLLTRRRLQAIDAWLEVHADGGGGADPGRASAPR